MGKVYLFLQKRCNGKSSCCSNYSGQGQHCLPQIQHTTCCMLSEILCSEYRSRKLRQLPGSIRLHSQAKLSLQWRYAEQFHNLCKRLSPNQFKQCMLGTLCARLLFNQYFRCKSSWLCQLFSWCNHVLWFRHGYSRPEYLANKPTDKLLSDGRLRVWISGASCPQFLCGS